VGGCGADERQDPPGYGNWRHFGLYQYVSLLHASRYRCLTFHRTIGFEHFFDSIPDSYTINKPNYQYYWYQNDVKPFAAL